MGDAKPFPIQAGQADGKHRDDCGNLLRYPRSFIPWWLAEEAYEYYVERFGDSQTLERLAERGGFGRDELLGLLRREI